ncbi:MAG: ABC transporter permease [Terriglobales bacterium]
MNWTLYVRSRLAPLALDPAREHEVIAELAQQLEQTHAAALAAGCDAAEARRRTEASLGDAAALARRIEHAHAPVTAAVRNRLPLRLRAALAASDAGRDIAYALRGLRRAPGFAALAVLTLALGIGANTAIFSWVQAELLQALPYAHPDRLLLLNEYADGRTVSVSYPDYLSWRQDNQADHGAFAALAWVQWLHFDVSGAGTPEVVNAAAVSANYFATLGALPALGRGFSPGADAAAAQHEAIVSWHLAERQFGTPAAAVGRALSLDRAQAVTVVGVLAPDFRESSETEIFVPDGMELANNKDRGDRGDSAVMGRLAPGVTPEAAAAQMRGEAARLAIAYPEDDHAVGSVTAPLRSAFVGTDAGMLWLLMTAVGLVLLIACANVANLMLVRTAAREQEFAVRAALGAGRGRLTRQLLIESLVVALLGAGAGIAVALAALPALQRLAGTLFSLRLSWPVLGFTLAAGVAAAVLFGLAPARLAGRHFRWSGRGAAGASRWGRGLVVAEVALALMLTAAAGLMLRSLGNLMAVNPGFQPHNVLTLSRRLAGPQYKNDAAVLAFEQRALARLAALPGVEAVGIGTGLPMTGDHSRSDFNIVGRPKPERGHFPHPDLHFISPGYLPALGLPLLAGRNFNAGDGAGAAGVVLISEHFARSYWKQPADALGQQLCCGNGHPMTIVGIVGNTRQYGLNAAENLEVYLPYALAPQRRPIFVLRTSVPANSLATEASAAFHALDPGLPLPEVETMQQVVTDSVGQPQTILWMLGIFGGLALLLAVIGIYGVISYATRRRRAEIGIRMTLGASAPAVVRLIAGQCMVLIAVGVALGVVGVLLAGPALRSFLFGVTAHDPLILAAAALVLFAAGLAACALPARRAAHLDPLEALRQGN